ncbi:MAG TPA: amidohydrolase family protein [Burkholderiaceae bacterium]|nr:amidohydrolase family protein [Burkholderiaceae bacterium]
MNRSVKGQCPRLGFATAVLCALGFWALIDSAVASTEVLRIEHVTIVSAERDELWRDATVTIRGGRIASISSSSKFSRGSAAPSHEIVIDGRDLYLAPGLIDSHVHLGQIPGMNAGQEAHHPDLAHAVREQIPSSFLLYGFTTLIDLVSTPEAMAPWKAHEVVPDTYFCGGAALLDGYPMSWAPKPERYQGWPYMLVEPGSEAPAGINATQHTPAAVVARMKADGAICTKAFYERGFGTVRNSPVPKLETIRQLVRSAHAAGLPVLLHANSSEAQAFGLEAGVDILAHGLWTWNEPEPGTELTPAVTKILDGVVAGNVGWQPTIQVLHGLRDLFNPEFLSNPRLTRILPSNLIEWYQSPEGQWFHDELLKDPEIKGARSFDAQAALAINRVEHATGYLAAHGANVLFGTDTPSAPTYANPPGLNAWFEMKNLIDAGLTPTQIFRAATLSNAQALHLDRDIGTVEVGKRANLLLLRQDPTKTIEAYADVVNVILGGRVLDPVQLAANHSRSADRTQLNEVPGGDSARYQVAR